MNHLKRLLAMTTTGFTLIACGSTMTIPEMPVAVKVPAGHALSMLAVGTGELSYECRVKANTTVTYEWLFTGPKAVLTERNGKVIGKYYGGPTWESDDGSKVTGKQVATAPGTATAIPLQLVKTNPSIGQGSMADISYIQRLNTVGGLAPAESCNADNIGAVKTVKYQADYLFYKAV
ncbi:DUF3455 domain-containing protein [Undibacterium sp. Ji22W]|uniref:DUF3455 domain-containing protein n=1 Tax=Undibacterium sp. Ji22W TaxID=3413038 RepID=UPI003BF3C8F8